MTAAPLRLVGLALWLATPLVPQQTAGAVPDDVMTLLRRGATSMPGDAVELRVGSAPDGFPIDLLPPGTDVFVASISDRMTVVAGVAAGLTATVRAAEGARLIAAGWIDSSPQQRGFTTVAVDQSRSLCRGTDFASVLLADRPGGGSLVRASITKDPRRACVARPAFNFPDVTIPTLAPPLAVKAYGASGGGGLDDLYSRTRLETTSSPRSIATYYVRQLEAAGWQVDGRVDEGTVMAVTRLSTASKSGGRVTAVLTVTALDGSTELDLMLHVVRNGGSSGRGEPPVTTNALIASMPPAGMPSSSSTSSGVTGDRVLSPVVVGAWIAHRDAAGAALLDLLVLWRGSPGWWQGESSRSSGGGNATTTNITVTRGRVELTLSLDARTRVARVQGKDVPLRDANVILVDDVDTASGPSVVRTLTVDPQLPVAARIETAIRRSPDLVAFLRCDVRLPDPRMQSMMDLACAQVTGK